MSSATNEEFVSNAYTSFQEDLYDEDFVSCANIIADVRDIDPKFADRMQKEYDEAKELYDHDMRLSDDAESKGDDMRLDGDSITG